MIFLMLLIKVRFEQSQFFVKIRNLFGQMQVMPAVTDTNRHFNFPFTNRREVTSQA